MPVINLGVNYDDVKHLDEFKTVPDGTYSFYIKGVEAKKSSSGRDMLTWQLAVNHPEDNAEVVVFYNTPLPSIDPNTGEVNTSGLGFLVSLCKSVGKPWDGGNINTDEYVGSGGTVRIKEVPRQVADETGTYVDDPSGKKRNEVDKFVY